MLFLIRTFLCLLICFSTPCLADELLKKSDVHKIMQQLFQQHVDKKEMTTSILKNALKTYIDQFDPYRVYLLENEVHPFIDPTDFQLKATLDQYKKNDLTTYVHLNDLIIKSIYRARDYRKELEKNLPLLIAESHKNRKALQDHFPRTETELKERIQEDLVQYIREQSSSKLEMNKIIAGYEKSVRHDEDQYLATDEKGDPLTKDEQENLFVLHVLKSLAGTFDAHTKVMNSSEAYDMKVRLEKEYKGVGLLLKKQSDRVVVTGFIPGSTVEKTGAVKINDQIIAINGKEIKNESFDRVLDMIRDDQIAEVALVVNRPNQEELIHVKLPRETITINEGRVESSYTPFENGIIGKITLHMFYQGDNGISSEQDVRDAITKLQNIGDLKGLVLDLRDNSGGFLLQAVRVAGLFISSGIVVISKYSNGEEHFYRDIDGKALYDGPLVVLTSRETASAAEIVSQALQDYGVALIAGDEQTYGKGTIQSQTVTEGGASSYFKVTVGKYYTVSGKTPQLQGVKADILVPSLLNNETVGEEFLADTVAPDRIDPSYIDPLSDIDTNLKPWYMNYYENHLQKKLKVWKHMVPILKEKSSTRILQNRVYQDLLKQPENYVNSSVRAPWLFPDEPKGSEGEDLQMTEAVNILKDMITLQAQEQPQK